MNASVAWILLVVAGVFEVAWAIGLKYTEGFSKPVPTVLTVAAMVISMGLLGVVARQLPIGTAYAVWTGIGVFGTAVLGVYLFGESMAPLRLLCLALIITGIVGLKLTTT
jgi:quaternary ammonium compound-resistance protein SugE